VSDNRQGHRQPKFTNYNQLTFIREKSNVQEGYAQAMACTTKEEFISTIKKVDPKSYVNNLEKMEYYVEKHYAPEKPPYEPLFTEFRRVPLEMREWVANELPSRDRPKTLVVWGDTRTGKTSWSRSLGKHAYLGFSWSIKEVDESCDYIVIDDVNMANFKGWQPFLGKHS
jgi:hypothetical protein